MTAALPPSGVHRFGAAALVAALALGLAIALPPFLSFVVASGANIPARDLASDYAIGVVWALLLGASILIWPVPPSDRRALLGIWCVKCLVALGFMLLYEANYWTLDAYDYFDFPRNIRFGWQSFGFGTGTDNVMALAWLHQQLVPASYHALKISCAMLGLVAVYVFYRAAELYLGRPDRRVLYVLAFVPSILFWSSILGKDPIVLLGVALYTYGFVGWYRVRRLRYVGVLLFGVMLAAAMRLWLAPILLAPLWVVAVRLAPGPIRRAAWLVAGGAVALLGIKLVRQYTGLTSIQDVVDTADALSRVLAMGGSGEEPARPLASVGSLVTFLPLGLFTALFRPLPGEVPNPFGWMAGVENVALLLFAGFAALRARLRDFLDPVVVWAVALLGAWASLYVFLSYSNLGSAARFKLQILPVLLLLLLYLARGRTHARAPAARGG